MLPAAARLRHREDFQAVLRRGRRASRGPLVVHLLPSTPDAASDAPADPRIGFVINRKVGSAVTRNLLRRRLRHLLRERLPALPRGARLVVRVSPGAAELDFAALGAALDAVLDAVRARVAA